MRLPCAAALIAALTVAAHAHADDGDSNLVIPNVKGAAKRPITIDDLTALRHIDTVSVSPNGDHFAIFVRQGDPSTNAYRGGWFVGATQGGALTNVGAGGQLGPGVYPNGQEHGEIAGSQSHWSPDGQWIAYTLKSKGEVQLWRSQVNGNAQQQITHNIADVREFAWRDDGRAIYFTAGTARAEQRARDETKARQGYQYDEDLNVFTDAMKLPPPRPLDKDLSLWVVTLDDLRERRGGEAERTAFEHAQARQTGGIASAIGFYKDAVVPPVARADGAVASLIRETPTSRRMRVVASLSSAALSPLRCEAEECSGVIERVWWSEDGERVLFWRHEGIGQAAQGFYTWSPSSGAVTTILRAPDDYFPLCSPAAGDRLICVRETKTRPEHLAAIDFRSGALQVLADVNPEFRNIRFGRVERYEWDIPKFAWNEAGGKLEGLYPKRAYGYILYPADFDSKKKYPVFIEPYIAHGFRSTYLSEHALHVYAANGFVVLDMAFPSSTLEAGERWGAALVKQYYSSEFDFPDMTMLMESTIRGLNVASARGFIDERRAGIGGVSTGTVVPLYLLQKHDRIAAISISSPAWGPHTYYWHTRKLRQDIVESYGNVGYEGDWIVKPEGAGREFWQRIDIADHVDTVEAPILMHLADVETFGLLRLIRHLEDAGKPYDTYVFPNETHQKWQPAHLQAIMNRNLDWFRFWLQDYEDLAPAKADQYVRWRKLRALQCQNPRSLRDYCDKAK